MIDAAIDLMRRRLSMEAGGRRVTLFISEYGVSANLWRRDGDCGELYVTTQTYDRFEELAEAVPHVVASAWPKKEQLAAEFGLKPDGSFLEPAQAAHA